ncbi:MAG TPA: hypothetical protein H9850_03470 [Candidatus Anaerobiospirillum pullistercoris]|uniref:Flavodoxin-like domain-containing protein n=1 Tax=Candidatus Anaerobiospirillum pullistercoris TaxID=2838452 RepID=A0A9D2B0D0_9GAMM|nr:hypothetical protein [Candidatus Anaerobiospirillum pullistercoris]
MRLTFTSKLFGGILGIAALIASTTPFWLFSSEEQVTYEQLKEKRVSLAAKTDIASTPADGNKASTTANTGEQSATNTAVTKSEQEHSAETTTTHSTQADLAASTATEGTATADTATDSNHNLPPVLSSRALIVFFAVSPQSPNEEELRTIHEMELDVLSGASSIPTKQSLLTPQQLKNIGGEPYEQPSNMIPAGTYLTALIREATGSRVYNIVTTTHYPRKIKDLYTYVLQEDRDHALPELTDDNPLSLEAFETIYLCYPVWRNDLPMAVYSFLQKYDLSGKNIIPIMMHSAPANEKTLQTIATLEPNATLYRPALTIQATQFKDLKQLQATVEHYIESLRVEFN